MAGVAAAPGHSSRASEGCVGGSGAAASLGGGPLSLCARAQEGLRRPCAPLPGSLGSGCTVGVEFPPWQLPASFWGFRENLGEEAVARGGERHECVQGKE